MSRPLHPCGESRIAKGGQPFAGVRGVPEKLLVLFLLAAAGGGQGKGKSETPLKPRQGDPAPV